MIIREQKQTITMIEQNHHAHLSAEIIKNWQDIFFKMILTSNLFYMQLNTMIMVGIISINNPF